MSAQLQATHDDLIYIPRTSIHVSAEFNPRKTFSDQDTAEFAARIQRSGWLSPLLVRPDPSGNGYLLVAGERRFRAVTFLGWDQVPVTIKLLDDVEHRKLALAENADRKELSVAEEAMAAQEHVDAYGGDHEQAAASLGWPVQRLRHRLRLLHASPDVMDALLTEKIQLGHAELLATLPAENQAKALPRVLEQGMSVAQLREQLNGFATPLSKAIFDRADCANCPFNSECQGSLFATHIESGLCTNRACFQDKTQQALHAKRDALRDDFGSVVLLSEKVAGTTIPLVKFGESGVGEEQYQACRSCEWRGACVVDSPGPTCGHVESPLCFNLTCHRTKVEAYQQTFSTADADEAGDDDADQATDGGATAQGLPGKSAAAGSSAKATGKGKGGAKGKGGKAAPQARATLKAVVGQYAGITRRAASVSIQRDVRLPLAFAAYGLLQAVADEVPRATFAEVCKRLEAPFSGEGGDSARKHRSEVVMALAAMEEGQLRDLMQRAVLYLFDTDPDGVSFQGKLNRRSLAARIAEEAGTDLTPFVVVDQAFLDAHTRDAMAHVLLESGFKAWMEEQEGGAKRYSALVAMKKEDAVKAILAAGFDFTGYRPGGLDHEVKEWAGYKRSATA